jgi:crotonobetainyl-CoA:carnitine CoA-transferase CaiB-like acyl-CoA transferase
MNVFVQGQLPRLSPPVPRPLGAKKALEGIVVVDFSRLIAGPYATMLLADLGGDVIKIENPGTGDDARGLVPPDLTGESSIFLWANRNKRSIELDLRSASGRQIALDLVAKGDVVVENFSTGVMDRLGLGYEALAKINPRIIYCAVSAFGRKGQFAPRPGYDPVAQAESGFISMNGFPGQEPVRAGAPIVDISTAMMTCNAILGALVARERHGIGQYVETALFDDAITMSGHYGMNYLMTGVNPQRFGNGSAAAQPLGIYNCSDGPIYLAVVNDRNYQRLVAELFGRPDLADHPDYKTNAQRLANIDKLNLRLKALFAEHRRDELLERAQRLGVPMGIVRTIEEAFTSEEMRARGMLSEIPHPTAGTVPNIAAPFCFHGTPLVDPVAAPLLGQHRDEILSAVLGYNDAQIAELAANGAFGASSAMPPEKAARAGG